MQFNAPISLSKFFKIFLLELWIFRNFFFIVQPHPIKNFMKRTWSWFKFFWKSGKVSFSLAHVRQLRNFSLMHIGRLSDSPLLPVRKLWWKGTICGGVSAPYFILLLQLDKPCFEVIFNPPLSLNLLEARAELVLEAEV